MSLSSPAYEQLEQEVRSACSELGRRLRAGESCQAEDFLARLPNLGSNAELSLEVVYTEFVVREEMGQLVDVEEWYRRFPQWKADLQQLFEVHQQVCGDAVRSTLSQDRPLTFPSHPDGERRAGSLYSTGRQVGNYEVLEEIGRGGMGVVYRARQLTLNRFVALKMILSGEFASPRELSRFQTEAQSAARLQHPNIVQIFEVGAHDRRPFLSMELVDGGSLESSLRRGLPNAVEAATLLEIIARAVQFAHEEGVVHRDLKPSNVLLTPRGEPKVADFGLAKQVVDRADQFTRSGAIIGTPSYMAPEQAGGKSRAIGPATDVYALGVILYEMLTGQLPFSGDTPFETLRRVVHDDPVAPSRLRTSVPRDLETIALKCLQKNPAQRYGSASELADDLQRFQLGEPILAKSVGTMERLVKWTRRRPALALFIASLVVSLIAVSALWRTAENRRREAFDAANKAEQSRIEAQQAHDRAVRSLYFRRIGQARGEWLGNQVGSADQLLDDCPEELRDWEWSYLRRMCRSDKLTLRGHTDVVWSLAYSPDGGLLASGSGQWGWSRPGEIILWDTRTGHQRAVLRGHDGPIMSLAFSPDGQRIASSTIGWENTAPGGVKIWLREGRELLTLPLPAFDSHGLAFSPDSRVLAVGGYKNIQLWDADRGVLLRQLEGPTGLVFWIAFSPDNRHLACVGRDGVARIYDLYTGEETHTFTGYSDLRRIDYSPDGRLLAFSDFGGTVRIWDVTQPVEKLEKYNYAIGVITALAFSPEGRRFAISGTDGPVLIVDAMNGHELKQIHAHNGVVRNVDFHPNGEELATVGMDGLVKVWDARTDWDDAMVDINKLARSATFVRIALTPGGDQVLLPNGFNHFWHGVGEKSLFVYDLEMGQVVQKFAGHTGWLTDATVTPDGKYYLTSSEDTTVRMWDAAYGSQVREFQGHAGVVNSVCCDPNGERLATASDDGTARIWHLASGELLRELRGHSKEVTRVAFSPDGVLVATASRDHSVRIWNVDSGQELQSFLGHTDAVTGVAFSHHGKWVASSSEDTTVCLWELATGKVTRVLRGHTKEVLDVKFNANDRRIGTCSADWTVRIWDTETGEEAISLRGTGATMALAFHPDGERIFSVQDWKLRVWDTKERESPRLARAFERANLRHHDRQAESSRDLGFRSAARFHYSRISQFPVTTTLDYSRRGNAFAELGNWLRASQDFSMALDLGAKGQQDVANHALVQLELGHHEQFQQAARKLLELIDDRADSMFINNAVWYCCVAPDALPEPQRLVDLMIRAIAAQKPEDRETYQNTLAAALLRNGRWDEAHEILAHSVAETGGIVEDWLLLAVVEAYRGNYADVRLWLDKYTQWRASVATAGPRAALDWSSVLSRTLLAREAQRIVEESVATK